ncbi:MAG: STAS domain-containing protein [Proteobacteria bacterium]|nr:STAS domain-containing protein [Pseudomonadota bacterium]
MALFQKPTPKRPEPAPEIKRGPSARDVAAQAARQAPQRRSAEPTARDITLTGASLMGAMPVSSAIEVQQANPGLCAILENAALLYASGQAGPARILLEQGVQTDADAKTSPLAWLALFDVLQRAGDRAAFDNHALKYVVQFERSAPTWDADKDKPQAGTKPVAGGYLAPSGKLSAASAPSLDMIKRAADRNLEHARLDLASVTGFDDTGARMLADALAYVRKKQFALQVQRADKLRAAVEAMVKRGKDAGEGVWLLSLELMQALHDEAGFDDRAIEYAMAFELSPPSWEPGPQPEVPAEAAAAAPDVAADDGTPAARGEMLTWTGVLAGASAPQLLQLNEFAQGRQIVPIDFSGVDRVDFVCAGALQNLINRIEAQRRAVQIAGATPIVRALLLLIGISPRHFVKKAA